MKIIEFNEENLKNEEIDKKVKKVRGIILNNKGEILLCKYAGVYLLPGGSIDFGETETQAIIREISEETGIEVDYTQIQKILKIISRDKNYYDRKLEKNINRETETTFFEIITNVDMNPQKMKLTESEAKNAFSLNFVNIDMVPYILKHNNTHNTKVSVFNKELLTVLEQYKSWKKENSINNEQQEISID